MPGLTTDSLILIIDGQAATGDEMAYHLRKGGFVNIVQASWGDQALSLTRQRQPDLIIADFESACCDSPDLDCLVRNELRADDIPVIVATSSTQPEKRAEIFSAGATDLIFKPIDAGELLARVRIHLEKRRLISRLLDFQQRMDEELTHARAMQQSLLPTADEICQIEDTYPVNLTSFYCASSGLGGDIWGVRSIGPSQLLVFNIDFSGHGVGPALNTFRLHSYFLNACDNLKDPADWLTQSNRFLYAALPVGQFATMFCGVIDFAAHTLAYACASSPPHLLRIEGEAGIYIPIDGTGLPLGVTREATYESHICQFPPGSTLVLFSDALIETPIPTKPIFTPRSLSQFLNNLSADERLETIRDEVIKTLHADPVSTPADDLTLVMLRYLKGRE